MLSACALLPRSLPAETRIDSPKIAAMPVLNGPETGPRVAASVHQTGMPAPLNSESGSFEDRLPAERTIENGLLVVQAGAFSVKANAERVAEAIGGYLDLSTSGRLWRVRTGPYRTLTQANEGLQKVQAAGYRQARIYDND